MPDDFSSLNVSKIRQLRQFKIDYSNIRNLKFMDKEGLQAQQYKDYIQGLAIVKISYHKEVPRPDFSADLRYLQNYSAQHFPKGKMLI